MKTSQLLSVAALAVTVYAQNPAYGQCGGIYWTGVTTCIPGWYCSYSNDFYSQCLQGTSSAAATTSKSSSKSSTLATSTISSISSTSSKISLSSSSSIKPSTTSSSSVSKSSASATPVPTGSGKFEWLGINESGAEFGQASYPGIWGTNFIFPSLTSLDTLMSEGYNIFRIPFAMERLAPSGLTSAFNSAYLANLTTVVNHITSSGSYAVIDPHNFGRYNGAIITDYAGFGTFWGRLASSYASNPKVVFDTNNEYHDEDQTLVFNMNQAAITSIRAAGATSQYIFVEGNSYSGAWTWASVNDNLKSLVDPQDKLVYEMHQYFDSDGSGTSDVCVSSTIGVDRVASATAWLKANGKQGIIGEFAGGANAVCQSAVKGFVEHLQANSDVWMGAMWWGGGPWWGTYIFGFEPPSSTGYNYYDTLLKTYKP